MAFQNHSRKHVLERESKYDAQLQRVTNAAMLLFGGRKQDALNWLNMPVKGLGNVASVSLLTTEDGVQAVIDLIGQLEYGVFS